MTKASNRPSPWEKSRVLRLTKLPEGETLALAEEPSSGTRAWILRGPVKVQTLAEAQAVSHHPAVLRITEVFSDEDGLALAFPSLEAATLRQVLDAIAQDPSADSPSPLGERMLRAIRSHLMEPVAFADERTWKQEDGRLIADLCLQLARTLSQLEAQGPSPTRVRAERLLLTPFGRVIVWAAPQNIDPEPAALHGVGEIVSSLIALLGPSAEESLLAIGHAAHPAYAQDRYESLADLVGDLERYLAGEPVIARRPGVFVKQMRSLTARPRRVAALLLILAGAAAALVWGISSKADEPAGRPPIEKTVPVPTPQPQPKPKAETAHEDFSPVPSSTARRGPSAPAWDRVPGASAPPSPR